MCAISVDLARYLSVDQAVIEDIMLSQTKLRGCRTHAANLATGMELCTAAGCNDEALSTCFQCSVKLRWSPFPFFSDIQGDGTIPELTRTCTFSSLLVHTNRTSISLPGATSFAATTAAAALYGIPTTSSTTATATPIK